MISHSRMHAGRRRSLLGWLAAIALGAGAARADAQVRVEIAPFTGSYLPLTNWGEMSQSFGNSTFRQTIGVLVGGRLRTTFTDLVGGEISAAYVNTGWRQHFEGNVNNTAASKIDYALAGNMTLASARLILTPRRANYYGIVGGGVMHRGGRAWDPSIWTVPSTQYNTTSPAGILGLGLRAPVSPSLSLDASAELHLHGGDLVKSGFAFSDAKYTAGGLQSDLIVTIGVPISLAGH